MRNVATNVREAVVPGAGHWLMEESRAYTIALIQDFLQDRLPPAQPGVVSAGERRLTPAEFAFPDRAPGTGTSGISGIQTVVLKGDRTAMVFIPSRCGFRRTRVLLLTNIRAIVSRPSSPAPGISGMAIRLTALR